MRTLQETDAHFKGKGATHYHDSRYPSRRDWLGNMVGGGICTRHYFRNGVELGYIVPDFLGTEGLGHPHYFDPPRIWGIPHDLHAL